MQNSFSKFIFKPSNNLIVQVLRYLVVGGIASVVDIGLYNVLAVGVNINHIIANTISFMFGLFTNYFMSREWVFNKKSHNLKKDFLLFASIGVIGLILSNSILYVLLDLRVLFNILGFLNEKIIISLAKPIAVVIVLFWNFIGRKVFVFKN